MKTSRKMGLAAGLLMALVMAGCSSSSSSSPVAPVAQGPDVPDSVGASVATFLAFVQALGADDESSEPLTISDGFAVPPDEDNDAKVLS